eukprot:TRINITY_DN357_c0_g1_i1.p1 TRINITY_DN357_c0_g1~~TRINITY_DN357_c0_g1_i1.p1  ORF type:complete len:1143 (-),score=409.41 TRINITY_DN357_c0_g1_i1:110-3538(-)
MKSSFYFCIALCIAFAASSASESVQIPTVADLRILAPTDIKITKDLFTLYAYDKTFSIRVKRSVQFFNGHRLEQYKNLEGESTLTLTVVNESEGILMGTFWTDGEMFHVQSLSSHAKDIQDAGYTLDLASKQVVFKESDVREDEKHKSFCGGVNPSKSIGKLDETSVKSSLSKRQDTSSTFAEPLPTLNCPTSPKTLTFSLALDNSFIRRVQGDGLNVESFVRSMVSTMSDVYVKTANVAFRVDEILQFPTAGSNPVWNGATCTDINSKLYQFSEWRGTRNTNAGLWHLLTDCYRSGTVGLAWIGVLCTSTTRNQGNGQWVSGTGVSSYLSSSQAWKIMAHEVGHNFGSQHTNVGIMIASNIKDTVFSRASQQYICDGVYNKGKCLASSSCTPSCSGKNCGSDGCGGSCGTCASGGTCTTSGTCQTCQRNCNGKTCGSDGCGGTCGTCASGSTCGSTGTCVSTGGGGSGGDQTTWINLHNAERKAYGIVDVSWDSASAQVASDYASKCTWGHNSNRGSRGENIAAYTGDARSNIAGLFGTWANEKKDWDCANNAAKNNAVVGHFTQVVWEKTTGIGCAVVFCQTGSPFSGFKDWTYAVCNYAPPGNYVGQRPFDASKCSGTCTPSTSCAAQGKVCGTINDGCKTVSCGTCGTDSACSSQGKCECSSSVTCSSAGRSCGTLYNGCNNLDCGTCASGFECTSQGKCVQNPPTCTPSATCQSRGLTCGSFNDGCKDVTCGACITGETCMEGVCKACVGCSQYSTCVQSKCTCLNGYEGDGFTCNKVPEVPPRGTDAWNAVAGTLATWTRVGIDLIDTDVALSGVTLIGSGSRMTGDSAVTWRAKVLRRVASAEAGLIFASSNGVNWVFALRQSSAVLFAVCGSNICSSIYTVGSGTFPSGQYLDVMLNIRNKNAVSFKVNGAAVGGTWTIQSGFLGDVGLYSKGGEAAFQEALLKTSTFLSISLVDCLTQDEFATKIAAILRVDKSTVQNVNSNCKKRQAETGAFVYTFELVGNAEASAPALASELQTKLLTDHPSVVGNEMNAVSSVEAVPAESLTGAQVAAITGGAVAAAALSTAAIIGIAVGGGVGVAAVAGGAVAAGVVIKKKREEENNVPMQTQGRRVDLLSSPEQNGFTSITARGVTQQ